MIENVITENQKQQSTDSLLTPPEAAAFLGVTENTLSVWRCVGRYEIPFVKIGSLVRYKRTDLEAWIKSRTRSANTTE